MGRVATGIRAFNAGKLTPYVAGRDDVDAYSRGCKTLTNFTPRPQGPASKRLGTKFVGRVKDSTKKVRLIEFIFSEVDSNILEFGEDYIRFYTTQDRVYETTKTITGITQANPGVVTSTSHGYANGDWVKIESVAGMTEVNDKEYIVANKTTNTFEFTDLDGVGVDTSAFTAYSSGGTAKRVYEIVSPYQESELFNIKYDQLGDIMYLTAGGITHRPQKLSRSAATSWTMVDFDNLGGAVLDWPTDRTITLTASGTTGSVTITASAATFDAAHVGSVWELRDASNTLATRAYFRITAFSTSTSVTATVQADALFGTSASKYWYEAAWSGTQGYPRAVAFHESRLAFAGTNEKPLTVWISASNEAFETFDADDTTDASGALRSTIAGQKNTIQWLVSDTDFLVAGTYGGLAFIGAANASEAISPANIKARNGRTFGSSDIQGVLFNNSIKYIQRSKTKTYQAEYDDIKLKYIAKDLNILNNIILDDTVSQMVVLEEPITALLEVRADGKLVGMTQEIEQQVTAFFEYETGLRADDTFDSIESVGVIPGTKFDEMWLSVQRSINGGTKRYIEYIEPDDSALYYVDCGIVYNGAATTTITGLDHLEGEIVDVLADGAAHPQKTVASGAITLDRSAQVVSVGRPYQADLEPMLIEGGGQNGPSQGKPKNIHRLIVRLYNTLGLKVGRSFDTLKAVPFRNVGDAMDAPPSTFATTFAGDKEVDFDGTWDTDGNIAIRHDSPTPCNIVAIYPQFKTNDK